MMINCPKCNHTFDTSPYEWNEILRLTKEKTLQKFAAMTKEELKLWIKENEK